MSAPHKTWEVLPHGQLAKVEDNIMTVTGEIRMPVGALERRMTVVRLRDRRLVVFSAIALDENEMRELEAFGTPAFLIVPNDHHRMDAKIWKDRYPGMKVIAPAGAREKVEAIVPVDASEADFGDPTVSLITVPGTSNGEMALEISGRGGTTLVINDLIGNIRNSSGISGWFLRRMGFAGSEPHVPVPVKAMVKDKAALAAQFKRWAGIPSLKRIMVSHGSTIDHDPNRTLNELAAALA